MNVTSFPSLRSAGLLASLALVLTGGPARGAEKSIQADAFPRFDSYIKITGRAASVTGNDSSYARRFQAPENGAYGIEALHYAKDTSQDTTVEFDGRALGGAEDYLGKFRLTKNELGSFEVGYKRFRTFYDGIGGFFPVNNSWRQLQDSELHTDRAKFWTNIKIARPDQPSFEFSYVNELRDGRKDTTIWGDTDFTGIPIWSLGSLNPFTATRKLIPSYIDLSERQETWTALMKHSVGKTDYEVEVAHNRNNSLDTRWINRYPGELKPFPTIPANPPTIIPPALANNPNIGFDTQGTKSEITTYTGKFETKVSDKVTVFGGVSYQHATADIAGNRQIALVIRTTPGIVSAIGGFTPGGRPPYSYQTGLGNTKQNIITGNLGVNFKPQKDLLLSLALKGEQLDMDGINQVTYINNLIIQSTGAITPVNVPAPNTSKRTEKSWVPELDVRYTGIKDLSLYGTFDYRYSPGEDVSLSTGVSPAGGTVVPSTTTTLDKIKLNHGHYKVGANWTVNPMVSLRGEFFYKDHKNNFIGFGSEEGHRFILGYEFKGTKFTAIVKPNPMIAFTTRYVYQTGKMLTTIDDSAEYESMDSKNHQFGETIDWTPNHQVYVQANLNVVFATISTSYPRAGGTANDVLRNADNDYINGSLITGFVVEKNTDAQLQFTYYRADNYNPNIIASVPYGAGVKEYTVSLALKHKFTDRLVGQLKVGYFHSRNDTTGGNTNFKGPMGYLSIEHAL